MMISILGYNSISLYHYVDGLNYIDLIDYEKFRNYSFDVDYLIYAPKTYSNHVRVQYKCSLICYKLIDEKYFEKDGVRYCHIFYAKLQRH